MKPAFTVAVVLAWSIITTQVLADPAEMRPGLWEHSFTMKSQSGEMERTMQRMQEQMANMPPEQRQMIEQMLADQGMQVGPSGQSVRICLSEEQAKRGMVPQQDGNCSQEIVERRGNTIKFRFTCNGIPPSSGEGEVTILSSTAYTGKSTVDTTVQGSPEHMTIASSGKWLSSDCGKLRPK